MPDENVAAVKSETLNWNKKIVQAGKVKVVRGKLKSERSCGGGRGKTTSSWKYNLSRDAKFVLRDKWAASKTTSYT